VVNKFGRISLKISVIRISLFRKNFINRFIVVESYNEFPGRDDVDCVRWVNSETLDMSWELLQISHEITSRSLNVKLKAIIPLEMVGYFQWMWRSQPLYITSNHQGHSDIPQVANNVIELSAVCGNRSGIKFTSVCGMRVGRFAGFKFTGRLHRRFIQISFCLGQLQLSEMVYIVVRRYFAYTGPHSHFQTEVITVTRKWRGGGGEVCYGTALQRDIQSFGTFIAAIHVFPAVPCIVLAC